MGIIFIYIYVYNVNNNCEMDIEQITIEQRVLLYRAAYTCLPMYIYLFIYIYIHTYVAVLTIGGPTAAVRVLICAHIIIICTIWVGLHTVS